MKSSLSLFRSLRVLLPVVAALPFTAGCGLQPKALFDMRLLVIPSPGHTGVQALCTEGSDSEQRAQAIVDQQDAAVDADRALLEAVANAEGRPAGNIVTYEVTVDGRTIVIESVSDGSAETFTGTIDGETVLEGATTDDGAKGAIEYGELEVAWSTDGDLVRAARSNAGDDVALVLEPHQVALAFEGSDGSEVTLAWNEETGVLVEGESIACWEGAERCNASCDEGKLRDLLSGVQASAELPF